MTPALKKICQRAEIPIMRMHGLRHCYASIMLEMDVPIEQISKCMGHSSVFTTLNTYVGIVEARNKARDFLEDVCQPQIPSQSKEVNRMTERPPELNPYFYYGNILSYDFIGNITKDRGKYRFQLRLTYGNEKTYSYQQGGFEKNNRQRRQGTRLYMT